MKLAKVVIASMILSNVSVQIYADNCQKIAKTDPLSAYVSRLLETPKYKLSLACQKSEQLLNAMHQLDTQYSAITLNDSEFRGGLVNESSGLYSWGETNTYRTLQPSMATNQRDGALPTVSGYKSIDR